MRTETDWNGVHTVTVDAVTIRCMCIHTKSISSIILGIDIQYIYIYINIHIYIERGGVVVVVYYESLKRTLKTKFVVG